MLSQRALPKRLLRNELATLEPYPVAYRQLRHDILENPTRLIPAYEEFLLECADITNRPETRKAVASMAIKVFGVIGVIVCALNLIMIVLAKASVETRREDRTLKRNFAHGGVLTLAYILLAFIKIVPFFFCILPGVYLYVKLFFTGFIITEQSANPFVAMKKSWAMTRGNFLNVLILFLVVMVVDVFSIVTVIGFIPGISFNYTLRAAAYRQLKQHSHCAGGC